MTKWKEEFDKRYVVPFDDGTNDKFINVNPNLIKDFISNLLEQVIDEASATYAYTSEQELELKQKLRDKYL